MSAYCTPETVTSLSQIVYGQLGFASVDTYGTFLSGTLIPAAQKIVDNYCDHNFQSNSGTLLLDGNGKRVLMIHPPYVPVLSAGTIKVNDVDVTSKIKVYDTFIAYEGGAFTEDSSTRKNVQVVLEYGYESVPDDIQFATAQLTSNMLADMLRRRLMPDIVAQAMQTSNNNVVITGMAKGANVLTPELRDILEQYRYSRLDVT